MSSLTTGTMEAMGDKSSRAAVNSFCLECCGSQSREVTLCSDLVRPLHRVRSLEARGILNTPTKG